MHPFVEYEEKFKKVEKKRSDALEMAAQEDEKGKEKKAK